MPPYRQQSMADPYKAKHEHWADIEAWVEASSNASTDHCILELRDRIQALEEAENDRRFEAAKALIDRPAPAPAGPLVARVLSAMAHAPDGFGYEQEARAAIRVIAGELRAQCFVQAADWLDQCANPTNQED